MKTIFSQAWRQLQPELLSQQLVIVADSSDDSAQVMLLMWFVICSLRGATAAAAAATDRQTRVTRLSGQRQAVADLILYYHHREHHISPPVGCYDSCVGHAIARCGGIPLPGDVASIMKTFIRHDKKERQRKRIIDRWHMFDNQSRTEGVLGTVPSAAVQGRHSKCIIYPTTKKCG